MKTNMSATNERDKFDLNCAKNLKQRKAIIDLLRNRYGREPTEAEVEMGMEIFEYDPSRLRAFFRRIWRAITP